MNSNIYKCAIPIRDMIIEWIYDGQIRDQHEEFFVSSDTSVVNDRLWHDKYRLRPGQIPSFINEEQANKVQLHKTKVKQNLMYIIIPFL